MKKILVICLVVLLAASTGVYAASKGFPKRDITNVVVWSAGGGTDTCNRIASAEMANFLGKNINVINKTGGVGGSVGMSFAYNRPHDGYTLCGLSESCVTAGVQGGWNQRMDVWDYFIVGGSPDIISVTPNTPYQTLSDLIEAAKKEPNSIKAGARPWKTAPVQNSITFLIRARPPARMRPWPAKCPWWSPLWPSSSNCCGAANCGRWRC